MDMLVNGVKVRRNQTKWSKIELKARISNEPSRSSCSGSGSCEVTNGNLFCIFSREKYPFVMRMRRASGSCVEPSPHEDFGRRFDRQALHAHFWSNLHLIYHMLIVSSVEETKRLEKMGDLLWSLRMSRPKPINIGVDGKKPDGKRHCLDDPRRFP